MECQTIIRTPSSKNFGTICGRIDCKYHNDKLDDCVICMDELNNAVTCNECKNRMCRLCM